MLALCPTLLISSDTSLALRVHSLQRELALPHDRLATFVRRCPWLLHMPEKTVSSRLASLRRLLQLEPERVVAVVRRLPQLLMLLPESLEAKVAALAVQTGLPGWRVRQLATANPVLLTRATARMARHWHLLHALAARVPAWREQLPTMALVSLAQCLMHGEAKYRRLEYVAGLSAGEHAGCSGSLGDAKGDANYGKVLGMVRLLSLPEKTFLSRFPGYSEWLLAGAKQADALLLEAKTVTTNGLLDVSS